MAEPQPDTATPAQVLARYHQAVLDLSADHLADLYAVDAVHEFPFAPPRSLTHYQGREQVREGYRAAWAATPVRLESIDNVVVHQTTDPEVIVAEQDMTAVVTTTGQRFTASFLLVLRVRDGLIVHVRDYVDTLAVARATGRLATLVAATDGAEPAGR